MEVDEVRVTFPADQRSGIFSFSHKEPWLAAVVSRGGPRRRWQSLVVLGTFEGGRSERGEWRRRSHALAHVEQVFLESGVTIKGKLKAAWKAAARFGP